MRLLIAKQSNAKTQLVAAPDIKLNGPLEVVEPSSVVEEASKDCFFESVKIFFLNHLSSLAP